MMDTEYQKDPSHLRGLKKLFEALEVIAWLHNCTKTQVQMGLLNSNVLLDNDYWITERR